MENYNHKEIEKKWHRRWDEEKLYQVGEDTEKSKYYVLDMFPYPSGDGLHVGHPKGYIATDIFARMKMMQGFNVLHPMGWDAFGLPAENFAIKNKTHPREMNERNIATFKNQLSKIGFSYDWEREINTTDPEYYKWTQWCFLKMLEKGLAYESYEPINWCPGCQTGLANEDLEDGRCERCDSEIEQKPMRQWVLKITDYADRMLEDLEKLSEWPSSIKEMQRNWIGRSEGAVIKFGIKAGESENENIEVFTTRVDTIFGCTYMVVAPEHSMISKLENQIENLNEIQAYIDASRKKTELERTELQKEKTGVEIKGVKAVNPFNGKEIPVFVADYVLGHYGTGAVMAVPAHDERDFEFAKKYDLPIKYVVLPLPGSFRDPLDDSKWQTYETSDFLRSKILNNQNNEIVRSIVTDLMISKKANVGDGLIIDSEKYSMMSSDEAREKMITWLEENNLGGRKVNYKLKDWVFSRQRYWGEPIPVIHCEDCKKKIEEGAFEINFYNQDTWSRIVSGQKTIETRALNPEERDRFFGDVKAGQYIKANNKETGDSQYFKVEKVYSYKNLAEIFEDKEVLKKVFAPHKTPETMEELEKGYSFVDGYVDKINKNGLVAWEIKNVIPGVVPVPEKDLPVTLPDVERYEPSGTGESPLATIEDWVNVDCPECGGKGKRETNTMPQWAGSSWYYLRYIDPKNNDALVDKDKEKYWSPVDFYVGGAEHATRHLIYARFWHKFLFDIGAVSYEEPFTRLQHVGLIMAEDGRKMSKRWGNVINPDDIVEVYGADALRVYEMFMGPFSQGTAWSTKGLTGAKKFLDRVWRLFNEKELYECKGNCDDAPKGMPTLLHKTIKKVSEDIENFDFNTAISQMMIFVNEATGYDRLPKSGMEKFLQLLAPFAPHMAEEIWRDKLGKSDSIFKASWPRHNPKLIVENEVELVVQVNGKVRDKVKVAADIDEAGAKDVALGSENVQKHIEGKEIRKVIFVPGKLISLVVG